MSVGRTDRAMDLLVLLGTAFGSRARIQVLTALLDDGGAASVSELARLVGMPLSTAAHHVAVLVTCGFVSKEAYGRDMALRVRDDVEAMLEHVTAWACESEGGDDGC